MFIVSCREQQRHDQNNEYGDMGILG